MTIRVIAHGSPDYEATLRLRHEILRLPLGLDIADDDLSPEPAQVHLAAFDEGGVICGCVVLVPGDDDTIQMRQLAVAEHARNRGLGKQLVRAAEAHARENHFTRLYCHARQDVLPFYETQDYHAIGEPFIEVTIPHQRMEKTL